MSEKELGTGSPEPEFPVSEAVTASLDDLLVGKKDEFYVLKSIKGKKIKVRDITAGDLADISKVAKGDNMEVAIGIVFKGMVEPKLEYGQVRKLDSIVLLEISQKVSEHSGLTEEKVNEARNLFTPTQVMPSGS